MPAIKLNNFAMRQFSVAKIFQENDEHKTSLNFTPDGRRLLVCDNASLTVYSCSRRTQICQVHMHHYQPELACFSHETDRILHSVTRLSSMIGCLDLNTRSHCRIFTGHSKSVRYLSVQPKHEHVFLSAGRDNRIIMWDFRLPTYANIVKVSDNPLLAFDPAGLVIATTSGTDWIEIHDVRMLKMDQPCQKFLYNFNREQANWTQMQFSPDGKNLLVATDHSWCFSVDAFNGRFQNGFTGYENEQRLALETTYTPDSQFVLTGADEGKVHIWRADTAEKVAVLKGNNAGPGRCMLFNPKATMFVSCGILTLFWMPKANGEYEWVDKNNGEEELQDNNGKLKEEFIEVADDEEEEKHDIIQQQKAIENQLREKEEIKKQQRRQRQLPLIDLTQTDHIDEDVIFVSQQRRPRFWSRKKRVRDPLEDGEIRDSD